MHQHVPACRRVRALAQTWLFCCAVAMDAVAQPLVQLSCASGDAPQDIAIGDDIVRVAVDAGAVAADGNGLLLIEERGQDLEWSTGDGDFHGIDSRPPRLGLLALPARQADTIRLRRAKRASAPATARVRLACAPDARLAELPACIERANAVLAMEHSPEAGEAFTPDVCGALLAQSAATLASRQSRPQQSLRLYERTSQLWEQAGDRARSAAAVLGATEQLIRLGRFEQAIERANLAARLNRAAGNAYFALRAESERCLAESHRSRTRSALECMRSLPDGFSAIGEINEAANTWFNLAEMYGDDGDIELQRAALAAAAKLDASLIDAIVRGRLWFAQASVAISDGRFGAAIEAFDAALKEFEQARNPRWVADTHLAVAGLYRQLGAPNEARVFVDAALSQLSEDEAPQRVASALQLRAQLHADDARLHEARADLARARTLFERLQMPLALAEADILAREWAADEVVGTPGATAPLPSSLPPRLRFRADLVQAREALGQGRIAAVDAFLARVRTADLAVPERLQIDALRARRLIASGEAIAALGVIEDSIVWLRSVAGAIHAPALRRVAARRLPELRALWLQAYAALAEPMRPEPSRVWRVLAATQTGALLAADVQRSATGQPSVEFDRTLARELLGVSSGGRTNVAIAAQRQLLAQYAREQTGLADAATAADLPDVQQLQQALPNGGVLLAFGLGEMQAYVLAVSKSSLSMHRIGSPSAIRAAERALFEALDGPTRPLAELDAAARTLGEVLLPAGLEPPRRLLVLADDQLAMIPYSLLAWPGSAQPMADGIDVSVVALPLLADSIARERPQGVSVLVASMADAQAAALPALPAAEREAALVRAVLPGRAIDVVQGLALDRTAMIEAFTREAAWVHVAAHGFRQPGFEGYAGIWLPAAAADGPPELVSWLDFAGRRLGAHLVVLNACQLARQTELVSGGTASFAGALSAAGVDHVVAALWPVSDAATALWVPAFYASAGRGQGGDIAHALRAAQARMRASRMFRHPYYWAELVHLQRGVDAD